MLDPQEPIMEVTNVPGRVVTLELPSPEDLQGQDLFVLAHEQENGQDNAQEGGIQYKIAQTSKAPGKRMPPRPKTG